MSAISGILMGISFPYTGSLFPIAFVAWVPLLFVEDYISAKRYRSGKVYLHAYVAFFFYNLVATWWVYHASLGGAIMAVFANAAVMAIPIYFFHLTKRYVGRKEGFLSLGIFWIAFEYLHLHWDLSWPWLNFGNTFSKVPELVQWYSYTGVLGGSLWIIIINVLVYKILNNVIKKKETWRIQTPLFFITALFLFVPIIISLFSFYSYKSNDSKTMDVAVLQPNLDPYTEKFYLPLEEQLENILKLAERSENVDLQMAPETALAYEFYEEDATQYPFFKTIQEKVKNGRAEFLIGASTRASFNSKNSEASRKYTDGPGYFESYNTSLFVHKNEDYEFIHKSKLVLGVEKLPFLKYLPFLDQLAINLDGASGTLGTEKNPKVIRTEKGIIAPVICYESVYGGFVAEQCRKGAEMINIITNDGWWKDTPGYKQHWSFARLRAIENRRWVARSANTGWSGFIDDRGKDVQRSEWWKEECLNQKVQLNSELSFYTVHGDILGRTFSFVAVLLLLFTQVKRFKTKILGDNRIKKSV
ncbi:MAG: apolipoprotein N-acyltransferase [Bacteroidetes bacterium]|nr:apolipoprotein N-acyltransferase [Bacteroidota bacterium]